MRTKERLAGALRDAGAPETMINKALAGGYDDYESASATPIVDLVNEATSHGLTTLAGRAMNGDFDATREEARAWFNKEGKNLIGGHDA